MKRSSTVTAVWRDIDVTQPLSLVIFSPDDHRIRRRTHQMNELLEALDQIKVLTRLWLNIDAGSGLRQ